jgi:NAD(P)-dependent dehydrogenase (short-subunit alcohol dehydrogenase family)
MDLNLKNKVFLITGAAGQIGSAIVTHLIEEESFVIAADFSSKELDDRASKNNWPNDKVFKVECDIRNSMSVENIINSAMNKFGQIDGVVNNAGVSVFEPFLERSESSFDWVMDVNLKGTFFLIQKYIAIYGKLNKPGVILNIASHYGVVSPDPRIYTDCERRNSEVYGATKAGIIQMTKYFAVHLAGKDFRVNCIAPGGVLNNENPQGNDFQKNYSYRCPLGRMAKVEEIVKPILFLLSSASSYINGQTLLVDGGYTSW